MGQGPSGRGDPGAGHGLKAEPPLAVLDRWEGHGAVWRAVLVRDDHAEVDLCACTGELMDRLVSDDPELIAYLRERSSSED